MILRPWFWLALTLAALWAPVVIMEFVIDPPIDLMTKRIIPDHSRRER